VTFERQPFLADDNARRCLRAALRRVRTIHPFNILALVLLPDHLHAVWELPRGDADYATRWRQIKTTFTRSYRPLQTTGRGLSASRRKRNEHTVWQRRFFEHTCRDEFDLKRCVDYTHVNPVKHKVVERVRDWPWSSFHRYVKLGEYATDWGGSTEWFGDEFRWAE
jgi:putative transposase